MVAKIKQFEKKIGYCFKDKELLQQALTHTSFAYENQKTVETDNETLEFLGDSVLGLIVADYLFATFPDLSEGDLSKLKSSVANTSSLSYFSKKIKLDKNLLLGKGEVKSGGRHKKTILAGAFEALTAAIYLDGGLEAARNFLGNHLNVFFNKIDTSKFFINNYKSALQEHLQKENFPPPLYKTVTSTGPDHKKSFIVEVFLENKSLAKAKGSSKKNAEQKAAQKALKYFLGKKIKTLTADTFFIKKKEK